MRPMFKARLRLAVSLALLGGLSAAHAAAPKHEGLVEGYVYLPYFDAVSSRSGWEVDSVECDIYAHSDDLLRLAENPGYVQSLGRPAFKEERNPPSELDIRRRAYDSCLRFRGYLRVPLTSAEAMRQRAVQATSATVENKWRASLWASRRFQRRFRQALAEVSPPQLWNEAFAVHSLRLDPRTFKIENGLVVKGQSFFFSEASYRMTGRLKTPLYADANSSGHYAEAGAIFYADAQDGHPTDWCGPFHTPSATAAVPTFGCVNISEDGYDITLYRHGQAGLVDQYGDDYHEENPELLGPAWSFHGLEPPEFDISRNDLLGEVRFEIRLRAVTDYSIYFNLVAIRAGYEHVMEVGGTPLPRVGQAEIPLWGYRLTLERAGQGVRVVGLTDDGDGKGPESVYPSTEPIIVD